MLFNLVLACRPCRDQACSYLLHGPAQTAVDEGRAGSISAWVNDALRLKAEHDRRMQALDSFLAAYEAEHGAITEAEIDEAGRRARRLEQQLALARAARDGKISPHQGWLARRRDGGRPARRSTLQGATFSGMSRDAIEL